MIKKWLDDHQCDSHLPHLVRNRKNIQCKCAALKQCMFCFFNKFIAKQTTRPFFSLFATLFFLLLASIMHLIYAWTHWSVSMNESLTWIVSFRPSLVCPVVCHHIHHKDVLMSPTKIRQQIQSRNVASFLCLLEWTREVERETLVERGRERETLWLGCLYHCTSTKHLEPHWLACFVSQYQWRFSGSFLFYSFFILLSRERERERERENTGFFLQQK